MSLTLTPPLQEARERLRRREIDATIAELVLPGAYEMLAQANEDAADHQRLDTSV